MLKPLNTHRTRWLIRIAAVIAFAASFNLAATAQTIQKDFKVSEVKVDWVFDGKQTTQDTRLSYTVLTQQGAVAVGKFSVAYVAGLGSAQVVEAYVQKSDGRKIPLTSKDYNTQTGSTGYHKDLNTIQGTAPDLGIDDILFYHSRHT